MITTHVQRYLHSPTVVDLQRTPSDQSSVDDATENILEQIHNCVFSLCGNEFFLILRLNRTGYRKPDGGALSLFGLKVDGASHLLNEQLCDRKVEAHTAHIALFVTGKTVENVFLHLGVHSFTGIF